MSDEAPPKSADAPTALEDADVLAAVKRFVGVGVEWPVTVGLRTPVKVGKELLGELVFQKGNFGILKGLGLDADRTPPLDALIVIAARLCGQSPTVIERLDADDVEEVVNIARGFFMRCQGAGKRLSGM